MNGEDEIEMGFLIMGGLWNGEKGGERGRIGNDEEVNDLMVESFEASSLCIIVGFV